MRPQAIDIILGRATQKWTGHWSCPERELGCEKCHWGQNGWKEGREKDP